MPVYHLTRQLLSGLSVDKNLVKTTLGLFMDYALSALRDAKLFSLSVMDKKFSQSPLQVQSLLFSQYLGLKVVMDCF